MWAKLLAGRLPAALVGLVLFGTVTVWNVLGGVT
jgi:hypothetical protein